MKIAVCGIGGIGGYFGGFLARRFHASREAEIYFIARGENQNAIRRHGLQLFTTSGNYIVHPKSVTSDASEIGPVDLLICCTKSYDLEESILKCDPCIHSETIILPLLNGVDGRRKIMALRPFNDVWEGCVYLVSRLIEPGIVKETGKISKLFFGSENATVEKVNKFQHLFDEEESMPLIPIIYKQ